LQGPAASVSKDAAVRHFEGDLVSREAVCLSPVEERTGRLRGRSGRGRMPSIVSPPTSRDENDVPFSERGAEPGADLLYFSVEFEDNDDHLL